MMATTTDTTNPYVLARLAEVTCPDSPTSPGSAFLTLVAEDVAERLEYGKADGMLTSVNFDAGDLAHEIADSCVPVYTYDRWLTFVDLAAWNEDIAEYGDLDDDMTQNAAVALYMIAQRLAEALIAEAIESADDDDPDEDDEVAQ